MQNILNIESKIELASVKKSTNKTPELNIIKRKPDLCYDLEHVLDRIEAKAKVK